MKQLTDLREILRYVPQFRDKTFVISVDGPVVAHDNFANLLLDIALLRSLRIQVVLVHGASLQIRELAEQLGKRPSNVDGTGITDAVTLDLAITAANRISHEILEGLSVNDLRGACCNAIVAHPAGILKGVDQLFTGRVERVDTGLLAAILEQDIIPVIPPLGIDGEGNTYRLNSDTVAVEVARSLRAVKLIYLSCALGIRLGEELLRQLDLPHAQAILKSQRGQLAANDASKLEQAVRAAQLGVPRIHIIDGRVEEGLLAEVFSNEGIGTLLHANEYQSIRKALKKDARAIHTLIHAGMESDELMRRTKADIERQIEDFYLFEVDRAPVACVALHVFPQEQKAELACLYVDSRFDNQGIGLKLSQFVEEKVRAAGIPTLFCLSTQAVNYFVQKCGFQVGTPDDLPSQRRDQYDKSRRMSKVLVKKL
ncbi:MAG TPA: amino-acid N-acetyltransferase [Gemmataceae bacterium]|nr:amino-acid N-acetyltransferase [Gemmataceae bacterium]